MSSRGRRRLSARASRAVAPLLCAAALLGQGLLAARLHGAFVPTAPPRASDSADRSRRGLLAASLAGLGLELAAPAAPARAEARELKDGDLEKVKAGYKDLAYLMDNWNKVTRDCSMVSSKIKQALASGQASPDNCIANPIVVRKYMGDSSIYDYFFQSDKLWVTIDASDLVPSKDQDKYSDAVEAFETHRRQASEWAYTSSWGEANPGGGRDKVEDYLLRSKAEAKLAKESLEIIMDVLKLA